jgi:polar amino acid transport system substrate-binding protein
MRNVFIALVALAAALAATAVASGRPSTPAAIPGCAISSLNLLEEGTLTIGADNPAFPPWFGGEERQGSPFKLTDPTSGRGYESAVAYAIARQLGFARSAVKWVPVPFNNSFKPGKKSFDFYITQVSYKPERAQNVTFSAPYYYVQQALVAIKGTPITSVRSIAGLRGYKLGAQIGTTSYDTIVKQIRPRTSPAVFDTNNDAVTALKNKQIDGLVVDYPSTGYITGVQVTTGTVVGRFLPTGTQREYFGLVLSKGNPLVGCLNRAIRRLRTNGTLTRLERTWLAQSGGAPILR